MCKNYFEKIRRLFCREKPKKLKTVTLIELLVSVAIVSLIIILAIGQINSAQANARDARRIADFRVLAQALEMYLNDYGEYPIYETAICTDDPLNPLDSLKSYLSNIPKDPLVNTQCYIYKTDENGLNFKIQTKLEKNLDLMKNDGGTDPNYYEVFSLNNSQQVVIDSFVAAAMYNNKTKYGDSSILGDWQMNDPNLFNPNPQTTQDSSGYQNTGQLGSSINPDQNDPKWQSGSDCIKDNCLDYENDDYVELPGTEIANPSCQFTLEGWVKYKSLNGMPRILEKFAAYWLYFNSEENQLRAGFKDRDGQIHEFAYSIMPQINTWYHLAWTYDCQKVRLYINGKLDREFTADINGINITGKKFYTSDKKIFFAQKSDNSGFLNGILDEIRIYNRALSDQEICQRCRAFKDANFCNNCSQ
jgi:type II secretory pathway pseudopilin PulG